MPRMVTTSSATIKGDGDASSKAKYAQSGTDVFPLRTPHRECLKALTLFEDGIGVIGCNLGRRSSSDMKVQSQQLSFSFRSVHDAMHYLALREDS